MFRERGPAFVARHENFGGRALFRDARGLIAKKTAGADFLGIFAGLVFVTEISFLDYGPFVNT
jgi:hypothetical protein